MKPRARKVAAELGRIIASQLATNAKDPRFKNVTISEVVVSADLHQAKVFFSQWQLDDPNEEICQALNKASPWLQQKISQKLMLKSVPKLKFVIDPTPEQATHIESLLKKIRP